MNANSKKLHGNGRWESSRMMLPEHREQYIELMQLECKKGNWSKARVASCVTRGAQLMHDFGEFYKAEK